jgi:hypothetical protein
MITRHSFVNRRPIKLTDNSVEHTVTYDTRVYFFGIRIYKDTGTDRIDCEIVDDKSIKNNKVGFKKT